MSKKTPPVISFSDETLNELRRQYKNARCAKATQIKFVDAKHKEHLLPLSYAKFLLRAVYDFNSNSW